MIADAAVQLPKPRTYLQLRSRRLGVRQGVDDLALGSRQLRCALKVLERLGDLALLQEQLRHRGDGNIALGIDLIQTLTDMNKRQRLSPNSLISAF